MSNPGPISNADPAAFTVKAYDSHEAMAGAASAAIAQKIRAQISRLGAVRIIFASAPSQSRVLSALVHEPDIKWSKVTAFHMDEYIGLPEYHPERFAVWLEENLFSKLPFAAVHPIVPEPNPFAAAVAYAEEMAKAPIDITLLGVGVNGHIAFNDPPVADFNDPLDVKVVELDETCRQQQVDDGCFSTFNDVPTHAITLTIPRLLRSDALFCMVPGRRKRDAVRNMMRGPVTTACPASILARQSNCTVFLDPEANPDD